MAWIELHQTVWTHRKTLLLAAALGIEPDMAATRMLRLWTWALDNCPDGDLSALPPPVLAFGANWHGDGQTLIEAMLAAGYLDREGDRLVMHDWLDYAGRLIERRREDAARKRRSRAPANREPAHREPAGADPTTASAGRPPDIQRNRTLPYRTAPYPTPPPDDAPTAASDSPPQHDLLPAERAALDTLVHILPGVSASPEQSRLLLALLRDYPAVDLPFEAVRCRSHFGPAPRRWAGTFTDWVIRAQSVRYWDGGQGPPTGPPVENAALPATPDEGPLRPSGVPAWDDARRELRAGVTAGSYAEWFAPLTVLSCQDGILTLRAQSPYHRDWLCTRLDPTLRAALAATGHGEIVPAYVCADHDAPD